MGRIIVYHDNKYLEWSSVVDAPVSFGCSRDIMLNGLIHVQRDTPLAVHQGRLDRAVIQGNSSIDPRITNDELFLGNRAGPNETSLSTEQIIRLYFVECREPDANNPDDMGVVSEDEGIEINEET